MIAICLIRQMPNYRREAFENGLRAVGYRLVTSGAPGGPEDLLVIWNRYGQMHAMANAWESKGGTVLVCENGYIGADTEARQYYAISAHGHNGSGWWPEYDEDRWSKLGIPLLAWKDSGARRCFNPSDGYLLVCGQRGIGSPTMASPTNWHIGAAAKIAKAGFSPKIRLHPGNHAPAIPLSADLVDSIGCVIWSSSSGVKALTLGIPVTYAAPHWICEDACERFDNVRDWGDFQVMHPDPRPYALNRMAHAQWSVAEIESGEPFARFRAEIERRRVAA